jgi:hypothetical protein
VTLRLILVLAAFIPETESQKRVRELEERLRQFPPAEVIAKNLAMSEEHYCWLVRARAAIPSHRRDAHDVHLADAERLYDAWQYLDRANFTLKYARRVANGARMDNPLRAVESLFETAAHYMDSLEAILGEEDFSAGRMPAPVPYRYFQWVN